MAKIIKTWHSDDVVESQYYVNENGVRNGDCRVWNAKGSLETQCNYVDGKIVGTKKFYDNEGKMIREIDFDFDGDPFVIKFFADEWTEERARTTGLSPDIENLTLDQIMDAFEEKLGENKELQIKLATLANQELTNRENEKQSQALRINTVRSPNDKKPRITFT